MPDRLAFGLALASAFGAGRRHEALPALAQGLLLSTALGLGLFLMVLNLGPLLRLARQVWHSRSSG